MASASLALALDPVVTKTLHFTSASEMAHLPAWSGRDPAKPEASFKFRGVRTVAFQRDIRPILLESCLDCHRGCKPKGNFKVMDRASLMKSGESRLATFVPGQGTESQLIRHVADQIEDMEMPPLKRRKTYLALTREQVQKLITWINEGAE